MELEESLNLNMYEMDMRQYDPAIARWIVQDPVVHFDYSPYNAFDNNPVFWADPSGADSIYNFETGQYVINGQVVSQDEAIAYAQNGGNADGNNNNTPDDSEEACCGEAGAERMIRQRMADKMAEQQGGNSSDWYNTFMKIDGEAGYEAGKEAILMIVGEWAVVKVLQGGRWVYKFIKAKNLIKNANWAQKTFGKVFTDPKSRFFGMTVDELSSAIRVGKTSVENVPIDIVVRNGKALILNTRSSAALTKAGIPRSQWNVINRTGQEFFENQLTNQLTRNNLTSAGTSSIRQAGTKNVINR